MKNKTEPTRLENTAPAQPAAQPWKKGVVAAAALATLGFGMDVHALALGAAKVQSSLGEPLRAEIEVPQISSEEASTFKVKMASPQAFQNAGIEYNSALSGASITLRRRTNGQSYLKITGNRPVSEPFLGIVLEADWQGGNLTRDYTVLVDPPESNAPRAAPAVTPAIDSPAQRAAVAEQVLPSKRESAGQRRPARSVHSTPAAEPAMSASGDQITVKRGSTAYAIAAAHAANGVSLDQMLVAMLRANPRAFIHGNVNLIRAGAVIHMPTAEEAAAIAPKTARRTVVAQTRSFRAYRSGLATRVQPSQMASNAQRASGSVRSQVVESRQPAAPEDRLVLPSGAKAPSAAESKMARSRQAKEQSDRAAELNRNIEELSKLQGASSAPAGQAAAPSLPAIEVPAPVAPITPPTTTAAVPPLEAARADAPTIAPVESITPVSSAPINAGSTEAPMIMPESASAPASQAAPKPRRAPPVIVEEPAEEPSFIDGLMENPLPLAGGLGLLAAALGGFFWYRKKGGAKAKKEPAPLDSSALDSRLLPDSFFPSGGGQKVNTGDDSGNLTMSYSPSQLDAAGDVDPVAEADVYLAYGRDMQAEEILREALRTQPDRISIHRKLAEIYAKRKDPAAFEKIAIDAHRLTRGEGADWTTIAAMGFELDPANTLYHAGGAPAPAPLAEQASPASNDTPKFNSADTVPQTMHSAAARLASAPEPAIDLDLDISAESLSADAPAAQSATIDTLDSAASPAETAPVVAAASPAPVSQPASLDVPLDFSLDMGLDLSAPKASASPAPASNVSAPSLDLDAGMIDFDMDALAMDPDSRSTAELHTEQPDDANEDPLATKLSLAQEFHAIGDTDGARAMVKEVIAESSGTLRARAERFLEELG